MQRKLMFGGVLAPIVVVALVVSAWAIDTGLAGDEVVRNVAIAGDDVGGLDANRLAERVAAISESVADRRVEIIAPEVTYSTTAAAIGLSIDEAATASAALDAGRDDALPLRPFAWLARFFNDADITLEYTVNVETARAEVRRLEGESLVSPTEPSIETNGGGRFQAVPGHPGTGIDPDVLALALQTAAEQTAADQTVSVQVRQGPLQPRLTDEAAAVAAREANSLTEAPLTVAFGDHAAEISVETQRSWVEAVEGENELLVVFSTDSIKETLAGLFTDAETSPVDASFDIVDGKVVLRPSSPGVSCCTEDAAATIETALRSGESTAVVEATLVEAKFSTEDAQALGITAEIGSPDEFGPTTRHNCCEGRVDNIHRIADIVRGAIILPGETFSLNKHVGERTIAKGFVAAGVIYDGEFSTDVGGGISQFATSLFNAALFGGLEFGAYQSHSIYLSRYPRGHEATISWGGPELEIKNPTPYGVLIWPTYTSTSITVHLYSTPDAEVTIGSPTSTKQGNCTRWTTPRTRVFPDGTTERDSVSALYRPGEGVNC